jgi:hypothetical protein
MRSANRSIFALEDSMMNCLLICLSVVANDATFENFNLGPNSFLNNAGGGANGFFNSGGHLFNNDYNATFSSWSGFAVSNVMDPTTPGFGNQYAAKPGTGAGGSAHYGVAFTYGATANPFNPDSSFVNVAPGFRATSFDVANTTYAYFAMRDGTAFNHPFSVTTQDFFRLTVTAYDGLNGAGAVLGSLDYYLADYRTGPGYIVDTWQTIDLLNLGAAKSYRFALASNDNHPVFGMNNPAYFAIDNLRVSPVPELSSSMFVAASSIAAFGVRLVRRRRRKGLHAAAREHVERRRKNA